MAEYLILGMGSPSDMNVFQRTFKGLGDMTPADYAKSNGVKVLIEPKALSCHNTPERPHPFAEDLEAIAADEDSDRKINKVVAVLGGGMSLALPGIVASYTKTVPIIGVPFVSSSTLGGGLDSFSACTNTPGGRAIIASSPIHSADEPSIDKAVRMAVYMLKRSHESEFAVIYDPRFSKEGEAAINGLLDTGLRGTEFYRQSSVNEQFEGVGLAINITDNNDDMLACDGRHYLSVQTMLPKKGYITPGHMHQFVEFVLATRRTEKSLFVGRPGNAAEFFARIAGLDDMKVRGALKDLFVTKVISNGPKYGDDYILITEESFE